MLRLKRGSIGLAGTDPHGVIEAEHENLAVADLSGLRRGRDGLDDLVHLIGSAGDFDLDFRQKAHGIFSAAINLGVALLAAVALHFGHREPLDANLGQRIADLIELEWLDDSHDYFHLLPLLSSRALHRAAGGSATNQAPCQFWNWPITL